MTGHSNIIIYCCTDSKKGGGGSGGGGGGGLDKHTRADGCSPRGTRQTREYRQSNI